MLSKSAPLALAAALLVATPALADITPGMQDILNNNYRLTCAAVLDPSDANMTAALSPLSPDFVNTNLKGKETKRDELATVMKQQLKMFHATSCDIKIDSATQPDPNTIVATTVTDIAGEAVLSDGKHQVEETAKAEETWAFSGGKWLEMKSKDLHSLVKVDGKVVQDQGQ
jgi:hypothetical protein